MEKLTACEWSSMPGATFSVAPTLRHRTHPEGLDGARIRAEGPGPIPLEARGGQLLSVLRGAGQLSLNGESLSLHAGVHLFLPAGQTVRFEAEAGCELLQVAAPDPAQSRGDRVLVRDETFLYASAVSGASLRWILTPQYLSRRIFLHHDRTLASRGGDPISWFRTTMFDVDGLPQNHEGESVFKMSYNSRTEWNGVYDVAGAARVRFAKHPYQALGQTQGWTPWLPLAAGSCYHLDEVAGGPDEEAEVDASGKRKTYRNKHEVHVPNGGHVSLFCLFDPAPTGVERHRPGEYSDYEPLEDVMASELYRATRPQVARFDAMVERLSWARARGGLEAAQATPEWALYLEGRAAQLQIERNLIDALTREGRGRERVVAPWTEALEPG